MRPRTRAVVVLALLAGTAAAPRHARGADRSAKTSGDPKQSSQDSTTITGRQPITNLPFEAAPSPSVDGVYRSRRYGVEAPRPRGDPTAPPSSAKPPEGAGPAKEGNPDATLDEARETLPSLIAAFVAHRSRGGWYALADSSAGGRVPARFVSVDAASIRRSGISRYAATVRFLDEGGRGLDAEAHASLAGDAWTVVELERRGAVDPGDARRCFEKAVKKRVAAGAKRGVFQLEDADLGRPWKLKLRRIREETLASYGASGWYACVDFLDKEGGRSLDVDFYASRTGNRCAVDQVVIHRVDGKARTIKPKPAGAQ